MKTQFSMNRSEKRDWFEQQKIARELNVDTWKEWKPHVLQEITSLKNLIKSQVSQNDLERWEKMILDDDISSLRRVMIGVDEDSVRMRKISPMKAVNL